MLNDVGNEVFQKSFNCLYPILYKFAMEAIRVYLFDCKECDWLRPQLLWSSSLHSGQSKTYHWDLLASEEPEGDLPLPDEVLAGWPNFPYAWMVVGNTSTQSSFVSLDCSSLRVRPALWPDSSPSLPRLSCLPPQPPHGYFSGYIFGMFISILICTSQTTQTNTVAIICTSLQYHSVLYYWVRSHPLSFLQLWYGGLERTWISHLEDLGIVLDDLGRVTVFLRLIYLIHKRGTILIIIYLW